MTLDWPKWLKEKRAFIWRRECIENGMGTGLKAEVEGADETWKQPGSRDCSCVKP